VVKLLSGFVSTDVSGKASTTLQDIAVSMFPENASYIPFIKQMKEKGYVLESMTCQNRPYREDQLKELLLEANREFSVDINSDGGLGVTSPETKFLFTYHGPDKNPRQDFVGMLRYLFKIDMVRKKGDRYALSGYFALLQVKVDVDDEDDTESQFRIGISKYTNGVFYDLSEDEDEDVLHDLEKQKPPLSTG